MPTWNKDGVAVAASGNEWRDGYVFSLEETGQGADPSTSTSGFLREGAQAVDGIAGRLSRMSKDEKLALGLVSVAALVVVVYLVQEAA